MCVCVCVRNTTEARSMQTQWPDVGHPDCSLFLGKPRVRRRKKGDVSGLEIGKTFEPKNFVSILSRFVEAMFQFGRKKHPPRQVEGVYLLVTTEQTEEHQCFPQHCMVKALTTIGPCLDYQCVKK